MAPARRCGCAGNRHAGWYDRGVDSLKGALLGAVNVVVVALGLAGLENEKDVFILVILFGMAPGVIAGGFLGTIARAVRAWPVSRRLTLLVPLPVIVVFVLAGMFGMDAAAPISCIPTCVAALILERWTRALAPPPPVPVAQIRQ